MLAAGPDVRDMMLAAYDKGLTDGNHVFFSIYPFDNKIMFGYDNWDKVVLRFTYL